MGAPCPACAHPPGSCTHHPTRCALRCTSCSRVPCRSCLPNRRSARRTPSWHPGWSSSAQRRRPVLTPTPTFTLTLILTNSFAPRRRVIMDCSPCIQAAALYTQAAAPRLQASREYTAMMGDVHGHNNDGSVDIEMASYKSQMGVRALVAIVSIAGDGGALQRRSRVTAALTSTATTPPQPSPPPLRHHPSHHRHHWYYRHHHHNRPRPCRSCHPTAVTPRPASPAQLSGRCQPFYP